MKNYNNINTTFFILPIIIILFSFSTVLGQDKKINFSKGKVILNGPGNLNVEGYDGDQVLIFEMVYEQNRPDLSAGLTLLKSNKFEYLKTAVDVDYEIKGNELIIDAGGRSGRYHLKIPRDLDISVKSHKGSYYYYDGLKNLNFKNLDGEIEVFADGSIDVNIENATGSISVVTYGNISASFDKLPNDGVLSFDTYLGHINLTLPKDEAANFSVTAKKGDIYSNLPLNIISKKKKGLKASIGKDGIDIIINAEAGGDIYLRKFEKTR